jgi:hypothetical protein
MQHGIEDARPVGSAIVLLPAPARLARPDLGGAFVRMRD